MIYTVQTFYPEAGLYMNTNHTSGDLEELKQTVASETFAGFKVRIVDETNAVVFEPPVRERGAEPGVADIAGMLGVPVVSLEEFKRLIGDQGEEP